MLQPSERSETEILIEYTEGAYAGERYLAQISFCPNPLCTCGSVELSLTRDPAPEGTGEVFGFEVNLADRSLYETQKKPDQYSRNRGQSFVEQLTGEDWQLLSDRYFAYKQKITDETPDDVLDTYFPAADIEASGAMLGFYEILPFAEERRVELDGRRFLLDDQYCVRTGCGCCETFVSLLEEAEDEPEERRGAPATFQVDYLNGKCEVADRGEEAPALLERMAGQLSTEEIRGWFEQRHNRLRALYRLYRRAHHEPKRSAAGKVGRNDPCPCGSGKKYKKCCMPR